jgi:hypothetical protein
MVTMSALLPIAIAVVLASATLSGAMSAHPCDELG